MTTSTKKNFLVKGYMGMLGNVTRGYIASNEGAVLNAIKAVPPEEGGFVNYSIEEVDSLPEELNVACPNCDHGFPHPGLVTEV